MHELSLANRLVEVAEETARAAGANRVTVVTVKVGDLSGVAVDALRFAFDVTTADTLLAGARLDLRKVPITLYCPTCELVAEPSNSMRFRCPACDCPTGDVRSGRELEVESIEVE